MDQPTRRVVTDHPSGLFKSHLKKPFKGSYSICTTYPEAREPQRARTRMIESADGFENQSPSVLSRERGCSRRWAVFTPENGARSTAGSMRFGSPWFRRLLKDRVLAPDLMVPRSSEFKTIQERGRVTMDGSFPWPKSAGPHEILEMVIQNQYIGR